ncbi:sterol carrier family protein [Actinomycetospora chibensis]|uniref:Sterol carrier family protein n=1 Tax=Actinomycetospora chibensis TaxID=663606 RepID=A0ABV9RFG6_9PSEU|nr:sterol carrier family protein [Actinomycetospora chibensis]MDD7924029.1 sterol carrier family protein [Actinomycetospora chibensis]
MPRRAPDPAQVRAELLAVAEWVRDPDGVERPPRPALAAAVRSSLRTLEHQAPGHSVEVRVPPFGAVQCVEGPRHTRGTPPNVVETDPATWLALALGLTTWDAAADRVTASGHRAADIARWLPVVDGHRTCEKS